MERFRSGYDEKGRGVWEFVVVTNHALMKHLFHTPPQNRLASPVFRARNWRDRQHGSFLIERIGTISWVAMVCGEMSNGVCMFVWNIQQAKRLIG